MITTDELTYASKGHTDIIDVTADVQKVVKKSKVKEGQVTVFVPGATASVTAIEYESGLLSDFKEMFERIIPEGMDYAHNERWQDGNGHSHVRASVLGASFTVPFTNGKLLLGTWQHIVLVDFDNRPRERRVIVQIISG